MQGVPYFKLQFQGFSSALPAERYPVIEYLTASKVSDC